MGFLILFQKCVSHCRFERDSNAAAAAKIDEGEDITIEGEEEEEDVAEDDVEEGEISEEDENEEESSIEDEASEEEEEEEEEENDEDNEIDVGEDSDEEEIEEEEEEGDVEDLIKASIRKNTFSGQYGLRIPGKIRLGRRPRRKFGQRLEGPVTPTLVVEGEGDSDNKKEKKAKKSGGAIDKYKKQLDKFL